MTKISRLILFGLLVGCVQKTQSESNATALNIVLNGNGPPVVLVHGFSQTHKVWQNMPVFNDLKIDHQLIAVDLRGHGDSAKPLDPTSYGQNMATDLVDVLDRLQLAKAHFVGFSMGASIVGGLLISHPNRVQTATLGSGFFTTWDEAEEDFAKFTEGRAESGEHYPWEPENQNFLALAAAIRGTRLVAASDEQIAGIRSPALITFGSLEIDNMSEQQRARLEGLPENIEVLVIDGADHDSEKAAILSPEFAAAVRRLIELNPI